MAGEPIRGEDISPNCVAYDFNQDGTTNFIDTLTLISDANSNEVVAQLIERAFASGCINTLFGTWVGQDLAVALAEIYLTHFNFCDTIDINDDNMLSFDDLQSILGSANFSVPDKRGAVQLIRGDSIDRNPGDFNSLRMSCLNVDSDGPLITFNGLYEEILNQINTCFEADMNGDGALDITDVSIVTNPRTPLSIPQRIAYLAAIRSPICAGGLDADE